MRKLREWSYRLGGLFNKGHKDHELADEIEGHLQMHIEDNLRSGMTPSEARRQAMIKLGGIDSTKEAYRDQRGLPILDTLWQDIRYGLRMLRKNPGFTAVAVLTLALGIGANTAIFSIINGVLLEPLRYDKPSQLVNIWEAPDGGRNAVSPGAFLDWKEGSVSFEGLSIIRDVDMNLAGDGEPERLAGLAVSSSYLWILRLQPKLGRGFLPDEDKPGQDNKVVVIAHELWQRRFGANPDVIGRTIQLNGEAHTIIGVLPAGAPLFGRFRFTGWQFVVPFVLGSDPSSKTRDNHRFTVIGRLNPNVALEQAQAELTALRQRLQPLYPKWKENWGVEVVSLHEQLTVNAKPMLLVLMGAVGFVLLIACANVANLFLAKAATRRKEMAIRAAVGASRWRLIRQMLIESSLLSLLGGFLGLGLAFWSVQTLRQSSAAILPRVDEIALNTPVFLFALFASAATGLLFGLVPALQISAPKLNQNLKDAGRSSMRSYSRMRSGLIVAEIGLALMLLAGAGLLVRSFSGLLNVESGFDPRNTLVMDLSVTSAKHPSLDDRARLFERICDRLAALPEVEAAGTISRLPMQGRFSETSVTVPGRTNQPGPGYLIRYNSVAGDCFEALGIPLLRGRGLSVRDNSANAPRVVVASRALAESIFFHEDPLGRRLNFWGREWEIVGIAGNIRYSRLDDERMEHLYFPAAFGDNQSGSLVVRTKQPPLPMSESIRQEIFAVDPHQPVSNIRTMEQVVSQSLSDRRFTLTLVGVFAAVALSLAIIGLYGVMAHLVAQRTAEIGLRMALGAQRTDVLKLILKDGMRLTLLGLTIGLAGGLALTRVLRNQLYEIGPTDPATFACVSLVLVIVALLACIVPAHRATRVGPLVALHYE